MPDNKPNLLSVLCKNNNNPQVPTLADLFTHQPQRFQHFSNHWEQILFDYSRTGLTSARLDSLLQLVDESGLDKWRERLMTGEEVNTSEGRSADHCLMRATKPEDNANALGMVIQVQRDEMLALGNSLYQGILPGYSKAITDVIHLGIGGSVLGPQLALEALQGSASGTVRVHFLSSADGWQVSALMAELNPESTAVIVVSKSFSTKEIKLNLQRLQQWLSTAEQGDAAEQLIAVTSGYARAQAAGFSKQNILLFPDSIGGRYSLWSAVGLAIVIRYGEAVYLQLLAGAEQMDLHFSEAAIKNNLSVLAALVTIWHRNVCNFPAVAVVAYDSRLRLLPAWLQQLDMESAGKSVDRQGQPLQHPAAPIIFGGSGTEVQHAFFQALYQGMDTIPVEFIGVICNDSELPENKSHNRFQLANLIGQADALAFTQQSSDTAENDPHRQFVGNCPSSVVMLDSLNANSLGQLLAFYEHRIFVQSIIWGNNPFDQFGVEFGKHTANQVEDYLRTRGTNNSGGKLAEANSLRDWVSERLD
ncbi:MAG: glucose-6-phosphate isomerase [Xanthomonadales bacterium]|nr:glucose-6-phosphate isomerase [Xanthomonadales bacterium]